MAASPSPATAPHTERPPAHPALPRAASPLTPRHAPQPRTRALGAQPHPGETQAPATAPLLRTLTDAFGRTARDLRVSLTDRCNLRCTYCMPAEGLPTLPTSKLLTDAEVVRLVRIAVQQLGIREVRFTGGEPLLRKGLEGIVAECAKLRTDLGAPPELSLTTNALGLDKRARALKAAGLRRVNVSLDAACAETYAAVTRRPRFAHALAGARAARDAGLAPVKVNAVLMPGINEAEAAALLALCLREGFRLRFIEYMPIGAGDWKRATMITAAEIESRLAAAGFTLRARPAGERGTSPAEEWDVEAGSLGGEAYPAGSVGIIASVTRPFCGDCDRTRLTADGQIRSCLFAHEETDLLAALRAGASDRELADIWLGAMAAKKAGHGIDDPGFLTPARTMSAIGG